MCVGDGGEDMEWWDGGGYKKSGVSFVEIYYQEHPAVKHLAV